MFAKALFVSLDILFVVIYQGLNLMKNCLLSQIKYTICCGCQVITAPHLCYFLQGNSGFPGKNGVAGEVVSRGYLGYLLLLLLLTSKRFQMRLL